MSKSITHQGRTYRKRKGLEGPFLHLSGPGAPCDSGVVLYYDKAEGMYYDSAHDLYIDPPGGDPARMDRHVSKHVRGRRNPSEVSIIGAMHSEAVRATRGTNKIPYWEDDRQGGGRYHYITEVEAKRRDEEKEYDFYLSVGKGSPMYEGLTKKQLVTWRRIHRQAKLARKEYEESVSKRKRKKNPREAARVDKHAARELVLFAENNQYLWNYRRPEFLRNMARKIKSGKLGTATMSATQALEKLWKYFADEAAKDYRAEFGRDWKFSPATRRAAAKVFAEDALGEFESGDITPAKLLRKR